MSYSLKHLLKSFSHKDNSVDKEYFKMFWKDIVICLILTDDFYNLNYISMIEKAPIL